MLRRWLFEKTQKNWRLASRKPSKPRKPGQPSKTSKPRKSAKQANQENHKKSFEIDIFRPKPSFSASGAQKIGPERYVYKGFLAGAANVDFWSPRCESGAPKHKSAHFIRFHRIQ